MTDNQAKQSDHARRLAHERAEALKGFFTHLGVYLIVITGLFLLNLATGSEWWFFFPTIAWGVALAIHGMSVGVGRMFDDGWTDRKARELLSRSHEQSSPTLDRQAAQPAENREMTTQANALIDQMRQSARAIPKPDIRQQALGLCASSDMVLSAIEENPNEDELASDFLNRFLTPASTIVTGYSRLANRNIPSARATLEKVETHDMSALATKVDEIYDRLHRGNLIDLEVAREMLSLDVPDWEDTLIGELDASARVRGTS